MKTRIHANLALLALAGPLALGGCTVPGMIMGAGATAGIAVAEERPVETAIDDLKIELEIKRLLLEEDETLLAKVTADVVESRVLLTGTVDDHDTRILVQRLAWSTQGVSQVISELQVSGSSSLIQASRDMLISADLRARLMGDAGVKAINYSIDTVRGTIYLLGIAQSPQELQRVMNHARNISGVRNIVPHVRMKAETAQLNS
jgi:osmotically-inducible protein OsmY